MAETKASPAHVRSFCLSGFVVFWVFLFCIAPYGIIALSSQAAFWPTSMIILVLAFWPGIRCNIRLVWWAVLCGGAVFVTVNYLFSAYWSFAPIVDDFSQTFGANGVTYRKEGTLTAVGLRVYYLKFPFIVAVAGFASALVAWLFAFGRAKAVRLGPNSE